MCVYQSPSNFGVIYDIIENKSNKEIIIASEKGIFIFTGKVLKPLKVNREETFHKLKIFDDNIYALSFSDNIYQLKEDSLILKYNLDLNQSINGFSVINDYLYISTPKKVLEIAGKFNGISTIIDQNNSYKLGLIQYNSSTFSISQNSNFLEIKNIASKKNFTIPFSSKIQKVFFYKQSNYFISDNLVYSIDLDHQKINPQFPLPKALNNVKIYDIKQIQSESFMIAHHNGISIIDVKANTWDHYFKGSTIHVAVKDQFSNLWLGSKYEGLIQVPSLKIQQLGIKDILKGKDHIVKAYQKQNKLFLGTSAGKIVIFDFLSKQTEIIQLENNAEVQAMFLNKNLLYVYCDKLYEINTVNKKIVGKYPVHSTKAIYVDQDIYCATAGDFQNITKQTKTNEGVWHNCMYYDSLAHIFYIGTKSGLITLNKNNLEIISNQEGLLKPTIVSIKKIDGRIFLFSANGNVYNDQLQLLQKFPLSKAIGVTPLDKHSYLFYNKSQVIFAHENGFHKKHLNFISKIIHNEPIVAIEKKGSKLLIVTDKETFIIHDYKTFIETNFEQDIQLEISSNIALDHNNELSLGYSNNGIIFNIKTNKDLSFFTHFNMLYQIGNDQKTMNPIEPNQDNEYLLNVEFLREGYSQFLFFIENEDGSILDNNTLNIHVNSPFWRTKWFLLLVFATSLSIIVLYQKKRVLQLKVENLEKIKNERMKNRLLRSELSAIRSQMNPHFVFNTLSTIQLKIAKKESNIAFQMVQKFSSLMRGVLTYSQTEFISIKQELSILQHYIDLEQERFHEKVDILLEIDKNIDLNDYQIPSLITQPIVENSLQHGLRHKQGQRKLNLKITKISKGTIEIEITDNGIGIEAAKQINKDNNQKKSFALAALKKRIKFINSLGYLKIQLSIDSSPLGTTTKISIHDND